MVPGAGTAWSSSGKARLHLLAEESRRPACVVDGKTSVGESTVDFQRNFSRATSSSIFTSVHIGVKVDGPFKSERYRY